MRLSVKVLGGTECCVDAQEDYTVEKLKEEIEAKLKLDGQNRNFYLKERLCKTEHLCLHIS